MIGKYVLFKALKVLLANPEKKFSVRELGREAGLSPASALKCFNYMNEKNLIVTARVGRSFQFKANLDNALTRQWKKLIALDSLQDVFDELFRRLGSEVVSVVLYGSVARGICDEKSDVDLLVVTNRKKKISISDLEAKVGREINLLVCTPSEWREKAVKNKVFYEQVILDSIALFGEKPVVL